MRKVFLSVGVVLLVAWALATVNSGPRAAFRRYVSSPVPQSVQNIMFKGNDTLGLAPECRCYLTFSISMTDATRIVNEKGFRPWAPNDWHLPGPAWFKPPTNGLSFSRNVPKSFPKWGQSEYFWIDQTGTNGFFMVWRRD